MNPKEALIAIGHGYLDYACALYGHNGEWQLDGTARVCKDCCRVLEEKHEAEVLQMKEQHEHI